MYSRYIIISIFILIIIFTSGGLVYISTLYLGLSKYLYIKNVLTTMGVILPIMFMGALLYGIKHFSLINSYIYTIGATWLGILNYLLLATFIISILFLTKNYFNLSIPVILVSWILIFCAVITTIIGIYNARNIRITNTEIPSSELAPMWKDKKIVFFSDIHLGMIYREKSMKKIVDLVNKENPDIIFIVGDLIDGPSFPYAKGLAPIQELKASFGSYYVEGNHEKYSGEYDLFRSNFPKNLNDITGKKVIVNDTQIIGIPNSGMKTKEDIDRELSSVSYDKSKPSIILMHDPKDTPFLAENNATLTLSGHTHSGQFFPLNLLVKKIAGKYFYGLTSTQNTKSVTTSGLGTAMVPIRVGTIPEIVVLHIK